VDGPDPAEAFEAVKAKAQWAEDHGFVWFSVMDHLIQISGVGAPDEPFLEGWTVLSALAAVTSRIRLATLATSVGYRNPAHLAKIAAGVDLISRGRLTLGIGAGYFETESTASNGWGIPGAASGAHSADGGGCPAYPRDVDGEATTFHGRYFHVEDAILEPKPVQKPRPPVDDRGSAASSLHCARSLAWPMPATSAVIRKETVRHKLAVLRDALADTAQRDNATI